MESSANQPTRFGSAPPKEATATAGPPLYGGRRRRREWFFRVVGVFLVPAALLLFVEFGLRLFGYGHATTAFVRQDIQGRECFVNNPGFAWRYFSPAIPLELEPIVFAARKPLNTFRIFVLGASAAQGAPEPAYAFGRVLEVMLEESHPGMDFEVLIPAMPAINSHAVLDVARECVRYEPDLMIVYLGNNEVVGPYGAGTVFAPLLNQRWLIRASLAVKRLRIGQCLDAALRWSSEGSKPRQWRGMEMFVGREVTRDDPRLEAVYAHFKTNLRGICRAAEAEKIPLLLCTVAVNLRDCPPFASRQRADLTAEELREWETHFHSGLRLEREGRDNEARDAFQQAVRLAPEHAEGQYRLARCLDRLGDVAAAREHYRQAREWDGLRFRADDAINQIIREVAREAAGGRVSLVDIEHDLAERSPRGLTGRQYFHEHVHFTFSGSYEVARCLAGAVPDYLPDGLSHAQVSSAAAMDEETCARRLAYTIWDQHQIAQRLRTEFFAKPPFTAQAHHATRLSELAAELVALRAQLTPEALTRAAETYQEALRQRPEDLQLHWRYGLLLEDLRQLAPAESQFRWLVDHSGNFSRAMLQLARRWGQSGRLAEAEALVQRALQCQPHHPHAYYNLGFIHQQQHNFEAAIGAWRRAVALKPDFGAAYNNLGGALYLAGQTEEAIAAFRKGIEEEPDLYDLHYNLGAILIGGGETEAGRRSLQRALEINPQAAMARRLLETLDQ